MATTFEIATRAAIEELIFKHGKESKFGVVISKDGTRELIDDLYNLLQTSRNLKSAGDRFLRANNMATPVASPTPPKREPR